MSERTYDTYYDRECVELAEPIPHRCGDCGRPIFYDVSIGGEYHHAVNAGTGCFLIPPEAHADDPRHPLLADALAFTPRQQGEFDYLVGRLSGFLGWDADGVEEILKSLVREAYAGYE